MKPKLFLSFAILLVPLFTVEVRAGEPIHLRVLSYNIHHAEGVDRKLDVERIARVIRSTEPDDVQQALNVVTSQA